MKLSKNQKLLVWVMLGLAGLMLFAALKNRFDFMANAPVAYSKETATENTLNLFTNLGIEHDTLGIVPFRIQRIGLYRSIRDSLKEETPEPAVLNRDQFYLHGWEVVAAGQLSMNASFNLTPGSIYAASGLYRTRWDNSGRVKEFELNAGHGGRSLLLGENNREFAATVVQDIFGYNLDEYDFTEADEFDDEIPRIPHEQTGSRIQVLEEANGDRNMYRWQKSTGFYNEHIQIELQPSVQREGTETDYTEIHGVSVLKFEAFNEMEELTPTDLNQQFIVFFFIVIVLLVLFVFIEGFGQLFKGKADWKRILIVALIIGFAVYGWRFIFLLNFSDLLSGQANIVVQFNQAIYGVVMGIFAAISYIGWEAYARGEKAFQMNLMDAFWRGTFFLKETGSAIIKGFSLGGMLLGITAVFLTTTGIYFFQSDSQFGYTEILNRPFFLTLNMSVLVVAALTSVAMVGVIYNFFDKRIRNSYIALTVSIFTGGVLIAGLGRFFGTDATVFQDIALFTLLAVPLFLAYKTSGVVTVFSGIWLFASITNILPYIQSPAPDVAINAWIQLLFAGSILLFGIAAYRFGARLTSVSSYVPEYEKKLIRNLRFENEMLIARETQEKLMPRHHPETNEFELYGYFMPSYEVGGDYFDYVTGTGENGSSHLTLTVVDVSGKSMRAAMHAVFTSGLLRSRMYTDNPATILREISPVIFEKTDPQTFITCLVGRYKPENKILEIANAGHCLPILKRHGKARFLQTPEPKYPLGLMEHVEYLDKSITLQTGDLVLFYSDGFPEAVNEKGHRIGFDAALKYVESLDTASLSAREICNNIRDYIQQHSIERLADDTTILCLKIK